MTVATQVISGVHVASDGGFVAGRVARATPVAGQHIDSSTVDATVLSSPISPIDGTWSLTLIRGVVYDVKIDRWAVRTIRVTDDPTQDFSYYLETSLEIADAQGGTIPPGSITQYLRGDRTWQTLDKAAIGLTHVDDTSDAEKPLSLAALEALDEKLSRPALTPAGKQLTFDEAGEVVASTYDVGAAGGSSLPAPPDQTGNWAYVSLAGQLQWLELVEVTGGSVPTAVNGSASAVGSEAISQAGMASVVGVGTVGAVGSAASAEAGTSVSIGTGAVTTVGAEAIAEAGTSYALNPGQALASSAEGIAEIGTSTAIGSGTATAASAEATAEAGTATASAVQNGSASATGVESSAEIGAASATGVGTATATGTESVSEVGTATVSTVSSGTATAVGAEGTAQIGAGLAAGTGTVAATGSQGAAEAGTATASASTTAPGQVAGVSAANSPAQLTVTWSAVSGATSYNVYYSTVNNSAGATKIAEATTGTSHTINGPLTSGTTYYVWVSAQNAAGEGALSASASAVAAAAGAIVVEMEGSVSPLAYIGGGSPTYDTTYKYAGTSSVKMSGLANALVLQNTTTPSAPFSTHAWFMVPANSTVGGGRFLIWFVPTGGGPTFSVEAVVTNATQFSIYAGLVSRVTGLSCGSWYKAELTVQGDIVNTTRYNPEIEADEPYAYTPCVLKVYNTSNTVVYTSATIEAQSVDLAGAAMDVRYGWPDNNAPDVYIDSVRLPW